MDESPSDDLIGQTVADRYQVLSELGRGGMGAVYRAVHTGSGRRVALKIISQNADNPTLRARFQREARAAGTIESKHIAQVLDVGVDEQRNIPFIAIEFLEGEDLGALIKRVGPLPSRLVVKIGVQAAAGLAKAHAQGIVHRDIKPANIFLTHQDDEVVVKLLDFGVAKHVDPKLDGEIQRLTSTGTLLGSPLYMSPEQALGDKTVDERSDLWSMGIVLFEALTGVTPFDHCTAMGALLVEICSARPAAVITKAPWVDPRLSELIEKLLQIAPEDRLGPTAALGAALRDLVPDGVTLMAADLVGEREARAATQVSPKAETHAGTSGNVSARSADRQGGSTTAAVSAHLRDEVAPPLPKRRAPWVAPAAVAAGVALVGSLAYSLGSGNAPATQPTTAETGAATAPASETSAPRATADAAQPAGTTDPPRLTVDTLPTASASAAAAPPVSTATPKTGGPLPTHAASAVLGVTAPPIASQRKNYGF